MKYLTRKDNIMREIEFRGAIKGISTPKLRWAWGDYVKIEGKHFIVLPGAVREDSAELEDILNDTSNNILCTRDFLEVIPETVGQYTGLKDKSGVKVFEDDKFKIIYSDTPNGFSPLGRDRKIVEVCGVVVYKDSGFYLEHKDPISGEVRYANLASFLKNPKEVIGNIHEANNGKE